MEHRPARSTGSWWRRPWRGDGRVKEAAEVVNRAADRIEEPPVQAPNQISAHVDLKTAKALGLTMPSALLATGGA